jgi:hypothetical protein
MLGKTVAVAACAVAAFGIRSCNSTFCEPRPRWQVSRTVDIQDLTANARAAAFLAREVPRWKQDNDCYSCHNNGDAARALIAAVRAGAGPASRAALEDTLAWLSRPTAWDQNRGRSGGAPPDADRALARLQFASATRAAVVTNLLDRRPLDEAAALVAKDQHENGSWRLDASQSLGSPATYGTALATWSARETLVTASPQQHASAIARADAWLRTANPAIVLDSAAIVLGLSDATDAAANAQRARALDVIMRGQSPAGGWGPFVSSPSEPFDSAIVLIALHDLARLRSDAALRAPSAFGEANSPLVIKPYTSATISRAIQLGREWLTMQQLDDGSWPETTRPARQESYAQRISTTAWATLALLAGDREGSRDPRRLGRGVGAAKVVHLERPADAVARTVFENGERHQLILPRRPRLRGHE